MLSPWSRVVVIFGVERRRLRGRATTTPVAAPEIPRPVRSRGKERAPTERLERRPGQFLAVGITFRGDEGFGGMSSGELDQDLIGTVGQVTLAIAPSHPERWCSPSRGTEAFTACSDETIAKYSRSGGRMPHRADGLGDNLSMTRRRG